MSSYQTKLSDITNRYGNVDVRQTIPAGFVHVDVANLQPLCRRLGIEFAEAMVGFSKYRKSFMPVKSGVVIAAMDEQRLRDALAEREARAKKVSPEQRKAARDRRQQRDIENFAAAVRDRFPALPAGVERDIAERACEIGSGRVGRSTVADDPVLAAVVAYARHRYTDYEDMLDHMDRDDARAEIGGEVAEQIRKWQGVEVVS